MLLLIFLLEHRRAEAAVKGNKTLLPCASSCHFTQYVLLSAHYVVDEAILGGEPLTKEAVHPHWCVRKASGIPLHRSSRKTY